MVGARLAAAVLARQLVEPLTSRGQLTNLAAWMHRLA